MIEFVRQWVASPAVAFLLTVLFRTAFIKPFGDWEGITLTVMVCALAGIALAYIFPKKNWKSWWKPSSIVASVVLFIVGWMLYTQLAAGQPQGWAFAVYWWVSLGIYLATYFLLGYSVGRIFAVIPTKAKAEEPQAG